jgi:hypothetical protein
MDEFTTQFGVALAVLAVALSGPALALVLMFMRKQRARRERRSPIGRDMLRGPGHSLREQLDAAGIDLSFDLMILSVVPLIMLCTFLSQGLLKGPLQMLPVAPGYVALAVVFVAWYLRKILKAGARIDKLKAGYDAELPVGQELDQLMRQGASVFRDLPADKFNIDHVVVSRQGIFAVETKGFTKPNRQAGKADATVVFDGKLLKFPTWSSCEPLEQAGRQSEWLGQWLSAATGSPLTALPVLALPGWYVERTGRGRVRVFSGKELAGLLSARGTRPLTEQEFTQAVHQAAQRCRTVIPRYSELSRAS